MDKTVLIADDEMLKLMTLKTSLDKKGFQVMTTTDGARALEILKAEKIDALVTDVRMPGLDGISLLEKSKELSPARPVLVMTGYGAVDDAVRAMRAGAEDYLTKPVSADEILVRLERAFAVTRMSTEYRRLKDEVERLSGALSPVVASDKMRLVFDKIERAADTDATVLLHGETGTGKEVCARHLHSHSNRKDGPFITASCAALAPGVVESELFGHEKGAFTGAVARRDGRLSAAQGGTLFLDDVDDIPLEVQTKLLRVLESSEYERVGGTQKLTADVRFVAATKKDLSELVKKGKFRDDLMYRLKVVQVDIPPLRERPEAIPVLANNFLHRSIEKMGRPQKRFSREALETMTAFPWPGNVRELEHLVESLVAIHQGEIIEKEDLPDRLVGKSCNPLFSVNIDGQPEIKLEEVMADFERCLLTWAHEKAEGNQVKAAKLLNIARSTFQYRWSKLM